MIYSKTGKIWSNDYKFNSVLTLDLVDVTADDVVYYHHPYDHLFHQVSFVQAVDPVHFEHMRNNSKVILIHENSCEALDARFAEEVYQVITSNNINPKQIKIITADENHQSFLINYLEDKNIFGTNVIVQNHLLSKVDEVADGNTETTHKFSSLSRNYKDWRLMLYSQLVENDLLKHFKYSFHNIWPYTDKNVVFTVDQMLEDLRKLGMNSFSKRFTKWLKRCPYDISSKNDVKNKWSNATYEAIQSADFHLMVETHFDQRSFTGKFEFDRKFGPSSITEKAYKAIACSRPFITFATPYFLEDLRNLGYNTFSPYIDESYDTEVDNVKRLNLIVAEVQRICNLSEDDYSQLVANCRSIAEFNQTYFKNRKNSRHDT